LSGGGRGPGAPGPRAGRPPGAGPPAPPPPRPPPPGRPRRPPPRPPRQLRRSPARSATADSSVLPGVEPAAGLVLAGREGHLVAGVVEHLGLGGVFQPAAKVHFAGRRGIGHVDAVRAHAHRVRAQVLESLRAGQLRAGGSLRVGGGQLALGCHGGGVKPGVLRGLLIHPLAYGAGAAGGGIWDADAVLTHAPEEGAVVAAGGAWAGAGAAAGGGDVGPGALLQAAASTSPQT